MSAIDDVELSRELGRAKLTEAIEALEVVHVCHLVVMRALSPIQGGGAEADSGNVLLVKIKEFRGRLESFSRLLESSGGPLVDPVYLAGEKERRAAAATQPTPCSHAGDQDEALVLGREESAELRRHALLIGSDQEGPT